MKEQLQQIEALLAELHSGLKPKFESEGPVSTLLEVISTKEITPHQRLIMLQLIFDGYTESTPQRQICETLGLSNKCVRENLNQLLEKGYVKRGSKVYTWDPN